MKELKMKRGNERWKRNFPVAQYLSHIDDSHSQSFVAQDGSILVAFPPLQHDLQSVGISLEEMGVLKIPKNNKVR